MSGGDAIPSVAGGVLGVGPFEFGIAPGTIPVALKINFHVGKRPAVVAGIGFPAIAIGGAVVVIGFVDGVGACGGQGSGVESAPGWRSLRRIRRIGNS